METKPLVFSREKVIALVVEIFGPVLHAKDVDSLAHAVVGAMHSDALSIHALGRGLANVQESSAKHAIKRVDRLLGNQRLTPDRAFNGWVPWVIGARKEIVVAIDWTEYADDEHHRVAIHLVTDHGRATPLVWKTVRAEDLKTRRSEYESDVLRALRDAVPPKVRVTVLGDRAFGDSSLYEYCDTVLKFDYIFRFRECILVDHPNVDGAKARDWIPTDGTARRVDDACVTHKRYRLKAVVCVHAKDMKEAWCLATSRSDDANTIVQLYGRRFTIEEAFRDEKDGHFGVGFLHTTIGAPLRRDRMLLVHAIATTLLTLLGRAGENALAYKELKANTSPRRQHSLFFQGREYLKGVVAHRYENVCSELEKLLGTRRAKTFGVI